MKKLKLILAGIVFLLAGASQAQISFSLNIAPPPMWGPTGASEVRYYYLPDVEAFYDVNASMFIYLSDGAWIHRTYLPARYKNYDLYGGYKVVMRDYHGITPYSRYHEYRSKYGKGYHDHQQKTIGERPGNGNHKDKNSGGGKQNHKDGGNNRDQGNSYGNENKKHDDHDNGGGKGKNR